MLQLWLVEYQTSKVPKRSFEHNLEKKYIAYSTVNLDVLNKHTSLKESLVL